MTGKNCENCNAAPAAWFCNSDGAYLCTGCDIAIHSANKLAMRHERIPLRAKAERDGHCQPCEPAGGRVRGHSAQERRSVNHGGHVGEDAHGAHPGPSSMDWLVHADGDLMTGHHGHHDDLMSGDPTDDPLSSLLRMEQEGQGNNSDFGNFGDDLFSIQGRPNPSGIFSSSHAGHRDDDGRDDRHGHSDDGSGRARHDERRGGGGGFNDVHGDSNSSGNSGTSDCTGALGNSGGNSNGEMETTLTRPFATSALRQAQLQRYRAKRLARHLGHKKIRYECRKTLADNRPRIKGRFAKVLPGDGLAAVRSCPDLPSLGKRAQSEDRSGKQSSGDSDERGSGIPTKGRRSRLSSGSEANTGILAKGRAGKTQYVAVKMDKMRRDSDGSERMAETEDGLGHLRSSTRGVLPYTQSEVSLAHLDRSARFGVGA